MISSIELNATIDLQLLLPSKQTVETLNAVRLMANNQRLTEDTATTAIIDERHRQAN